MDILGVVGFSFFKKISNYVCLLEKFFKIAKGNK